MLLGAVREQRHRRCQLLPMYNCTFVLLHDEYCCWVKSCCLGGCITLCYWESHVSFNAWSPATMALHCPEHAKLFANVKCSADELQDCIVHQQRSHCCAACQQPDRALKNVGPTTWIPAYPHAPRARLVRCLEQPGSHPVTGLYWDRPCAYKTLVIGCMNVQVQDKHIGCLVSSNLACALTCRARPRVPREPGCRETRFVFVFGEPGSLGRFARREPGSARYPANHTLASCISRARLRYLQLTKRAL